MTTSLGVSIVVSLSITYTIITGGYAIVSDVN